MRKRRSLRGLGSSSATHEKMALADYNQALRQFSKAKAKAATKSCVAAYDALRNGIRDMGAGYAHEFAWADSTEEMDVKVDEVAGAELEAEATFKTSCLRRSVLSGLGARRKRSR